MDKEIKKEFNNLALIVKAGFDGVDKRFDGVDKRFDGVDKRLNTLEQGHEDIKLKLDNVAYRFELNDLEKRVEKIEHKLKLSLDKI